MSQRQTEALFRESQLKLVCSERCLGGKFLFSAKELTILFCSAEIGPISTVVAEDIFSKISSPFKVFSV